jgi:hypothetical protein
VHGVIVKILYSVMTHCPADHAGILVLRICSLFVSGDSASGKSGVGMIFFAGQVLRSWRCVRRQPVCASADLSDGGASPELVLVAARVVLLDCRSRATFALNGRAGCEGGDFDISYTLDVAAKSQAARFFVTLFLCR